MGRDPGQGAEVTLTRVMRRRKPSDVRRAERYRVLRALEVPSSVATDACQTPRRFAAALTWCGIPESAYPELCSVVPGGKPRGVDTPALAANRARYRALRELGASAEFANARRSATSFACAIERIATGTLKRGA